VCWHSGHLRLVFCGGMKVLVFSGKLSSESK